MVYVKRLVNKSINCDLSLPGNFLVIPFYTCITCLSGQLQLVRLPESSNKLPELLDIISAPQKVVYTMGRSVTFIFYAPTGSCWIEGPLRSTGRRIPAMGAPTVSGTRVQSGNLMPIFFPSGVTTTGAVVSSGS